MTGETLDEAGAWTLRVRDGALEAAKPVPFDGVLYFSTRDRRNSPRRNSRYQMAVRDVVQAYVGHADTDAGADELLATAREALADGGADR